MDDEEEEEDDRGEVVVGVVEKDEGGGGGGGSGGAMVLRCSMDRLEVSEEVTTTWRGNEELSRIVSVVALGDDSKAVVGSDPRNPGCVPYEEDFLAGEGGISV